MLTPIPIQTPEKRMATAAGRKKTATTTTTPTRMMIQVKMIQKAKMMPKTVQIQLIRIPAPMNPRHLPQAKKTNLREKRTGKNPNQDMTAMTSKVAPGKTPQRARLMTVQKPTNQKRICQTAKKDKGRKAVPMEPGMKIVSGHCKTKRRKTRIHQAVKQKLKAKEAKALKVGKKPPQKAEKSLQKKARRSQKKHPVKQQRKYGVG